MGGAVSLLALDLATRLGWAFRSAERRVTHGSHKLPETAEDVGRFLNAYDLYLNDLITFHGPTIVAYEAPWVGPDTHQNTARKLLCLAGHTEFVCRRRQIECREGNIPAVRKHFIGKGNAKRDEAKRLTMEVCRRRGWSPKNDDEADALALLDYGMHTLRLPGLDVGKGFFAGVTS
jgi:Holliday junction resolvasome RuvABC endonuclease subunit